MYRPENIEKLIQKRIADELLKQRSSGLYLTPEQLSERWQISLKALDKWRLQGKPPIYMKVQGNHKSAIRYVLHGENGVIDVEEKWLRSSTTDTGLALIRGV